MDSRLSSPPFLVSHIQSSVTRPAGVCAIAALFAVVAVYLLSIGLIMLVAQGQVSVALGAPLLFGLELAGPYMFLLMASVGALIAWGLWRLNNWARRVAVIIAMVGVVLLVPKVSNAATTTQYGNLALGGLQIMVRVIVAWYLYQAPIVDVFEHH
jgi:hypothetical protein